MAGDWIKMRGNLWDDPRVARLCDLCDCGEAAAVGGLYWLWATADQHTEDGCLHGLSLGAIDRKTGVKGFGAALKSIGWLVETADGVEVPRFEEHNGSSAKRRALDAQRKANVRNLSASGADNERTACGQNAPDCGAREREEKREREEPPNPPPSGGVADAATGGKGTAPRARGTNPRAVGEGFDRWWAVYPRRVSKGDAEKAWRTLKPDGALVDRIVQATEVAARRDRWREDGGRYVPYPASWLRARGWEDDDVQPQRAGGSEWWLAKGYGNEAMALADGVEAPR